MIATTDQNQVVQFSARYKPFGDVLASTGTSPAFTWVGTRGYLSSAGRPHATYSVRARIFSGTEARWTSVDELWPTELAYIYAQANPGTMFDATGKMCHTSEAAFAGAMGKRSGQSSYGHSQRIVASVAGFVGYRPALMHKPEPCHDMLKYIPPFAMGPYINCLKELGPNPTPQEIAECFDELPSEAKGQLTGDICDYMACIVNSQSHPPSDPCTDPAVDAIHCCARKYYGSVCKCVMKYSSSPGLGACLIAARASATHCAECWRE